MEGMADVTITLFLSQCQAWSQVLESQITLVPLLWASWDAFWFRGLSRDASLDLPAL